MAFNPFHRFRKHQKVIFAVLTIMCMFVFVLQFGQGDFFTRASRWFGAAKGQGQLVATVNGNKLYESDLFGQRGLQGKRQLANMFMEFLRYRAVRDVINDPRGKGEGVNPQLAKIIQDLGQSNPFMFATGGTEQLRTIQFLQAELKGKEGKEDERRYLEQVAAVIQIEATAAQLSFLIQFSQGQRPVDTTFFGPWNTAEELLDYKVWLHQADKLGIVLTENVTRQLIQRDTAGRNVLPEGSFKADKDFQPFMSSKRMDVFTLYSESDILNILADEYRVIMAQQALLGQALTYRGTPGSLAQEQLRQVWQERFPFGRQDLFAEAPVGKMEPVTTTPGQYLQYFREQRTTASAALLPISVDQFVPQVTEQPSEAQLRDLYERYKDFDPEPSRPYPGFMEPRSVRLQYFQVSAKSEFYQNQAKKFFAPTTAVNELDLAIARQVLAGFGSVATSGAPLISNPVLQQYGKYSDALRTSSVKGESVPPDIYDPSYDMASAVGHIVGDLAQGNPLAAPVAITGTARAHAQLQARGVGAALMQVTMPTPGLGGLLPAMISYVQPLDKVDAYIVEKTREEVAKKLVEANLARFRDELTKLQGKTAEAKAFVEKSAKEYDFQLQTMTSPRNRLTISDDPALKDLREGFAKRTPTPVTTPEEFAVYMSVFPTGLYQLQSGENQRPFPNDFNTPDQTYYTYWLVEDNPAKVRPFADAKPDVIAAWKRMQARKLAIKAAKAIEADAAKKSKEWPSDFSNRKDTVLAFLDHYKYGNAFVLDKILRQAEVPTPTPGRNTKYIPYMPPEDKIKYPPLKFTDWVMRLEKPGDTTYVADRPESTIYVAVLLDRKEPTFADFDRSYQRASMRDQADSLWKDFMATQRGDFRKQHMEKLRTAAAPDDTDNGQWKLKDEVRKHTARGGMPSDEGD